MATKVLHISELLLNPYVQSNPIQVHPTANLSWVSSTCSTTNQQLNYILTRYG